MKTQQAVKTLAHMIAAGEVSGNINIREALELYNDGLRTPRNKYIKNQPRFYNRAMSSNTRALKYGCEGKLTHEDFELVFKRDNGICKQCKTDKNIIFDHVISFYKRGTNTIDNLQLLCKTCNLLKGVN